MGVINGEFKEYKLDNSLVVALQKTSTSNIEGVLQVGFGTVHENEGEEGVAHFLEHCLFTGGSDKYSPEEGLKIRSELGYANASTGYGETVFETGLMPDDLEKSLDLFSSIVSNPRLDEEVIEMERRRILREISQNKTSYCNNRHNSDGTARNPSPFFHTPQTKSCNKMQYSKSKRQNKLVS